MSTRMRILALSLPLAWLPLGGQAQPPAASPYVALDAKGKKTTPKTGVRPHPCVLDTATGLVWEVKTGDKGPGDKNWTFTWFDKNMREEVMPMGYENGGSCFNKGSCDTSGYVAATNKRRLCGFSDWRLPTADELAGLQRPDLPKKIDERFFPNSLATYYWSGTYVALEVGGAMFVNFDHGMTLPGNSAASAAVRLVRGPDRKP